MIALPAGIRVVVTTRPVDFRKGMDGLAALVQQSLAMSPFSGDVFVFRSRRADRVRILVWDGTGLVLYQKRLEAGRFVWPAVADGTMTLTAAQLSALLDGVNWRRVKALQVIPPARAC